MLWHRGGVGPKDRGRWKCQCSGYGKWAGEVMLQCFPEPDGQCRCPYTAFFSRYVCRATLMGVSAPVVKGPRVRLALARETTARVRILASVSNCPETNQWVERVQWCQRML